MKYHHIYLILSWSNKLKYQFLINDKFVISTSSIIVSFQRKSFDESFRSTSGKNEWKPQLLQEAENQPSPAESVEIKSFVNTFSIGNIYTLTHIYRLDMNLGKGSEPHMGWGWGFPMFVVEKEEILIFLFFKMKHYNIMKNRGIIF